MATRTPEDDKLPLDPRDPHSLDWHLSDENPAMKWRVRTEAPTSEGWLIGALERLLLPAFAQIVETIVREELKSAMSGMRMNMSVGLGNSEVLPSVTRICPVCGINPLSGKQQTCSVKCRVARHRNK